MNSELEQRKVVLVHDWLTGMRGGERVLESLCRMFPDAPIYTLLCNFAAVSDLIRRHAIKTSWLQTVPGISRFYRYFLPFFPRAIESLRPVEAGLVISTSHCVAKGFCPPPGARHLCYCFTPMRYAWLFYEEYFGANYLKKKTLQPMLQNLREWDRVASERVTRFVALSRHVQKRIEEFYGREADVVYPPVQTAFWTPEAGIAGASARPGRELGGYDLIVSALVPYKKIDLAVRAYAQYGYPLKIVGTGTEYRRLRALAGEQTEFLGHLDDGAIRDLYRRCRMLIFPGEEDFGIVPVEVQACGRPVVAFGRGGTLETVVANKSGVFFEEQTPEALLDAVERCASAVWDPALIRAQAEKFSEAAFIKGMNDSISLCLRQ